MGDEDMDPCQSLYGHEFAMRRLLNIIRNSQTVCNDNECFEISSPNDDVLTNTLYMTVFMMVAFFLFYFRPRSQRALGDTPKATRRENPDNEPPPTTY